MKHILSSFILLLAFLLGLSINSRAAVHVVEARNFFYAPSSVSITLGDTVRFMWVEGNHPTASLTGTFPNFPLDVFNPQFDLVLSTTGTYPYECVIHAGVGMVGTIMVTSTSAPCGPTSPPVNLSQTAVPTAASIMWDPLPNAVLYQVRGREVGVIDFGSKTISGTSLIVSGLIPGTAYEWKVRALCAGTDEITTFSAKSSFTTPVLAREAGDKPIPAVSIVGSPPGIQFTEPLQRSANLVISDLLGRIVIQRNIPSGTQFWPLNDSGLKESGFYVVEVAGMTGQKVELQAKDSPSPQEAKESWSGLYHHSR